MMADRLSPQDSFQSGKIFKRSFKACLNCRTRKTKCDLGPPSSPQEPPCARCRRERRECVFIDSRRGIKRPKPPIVGHISSPTFVAPTLEQQRSLINSYTKLPTRSNSTGEVSTMQGALLFLANAAGNIAKADQRDRMNGTRNENRENSDHSDSQLATQNLSYFKYIGEGKLLSESATIKLVDFFFIYLHPFFPYIPPDLHSAKALSGYPILLCTVLTIASRYKPSDAIGLVESNDQFAVHDALWLHCQEMISQSVWGEASTRSLGTVFSFLLFTEWNPRAIHWLLEDYANSSAAASKEDDNNVAGIGAMRRSGRMAWMLIGSAVRLAQDMGFMENSSRVFVATHISETTTAMTVGQRSMLAQSLAEVNLSDVDSFEELRQVEDLLVLKGDEEALRTKANGKLKFTHIQRANVELLKICSLAYETLYCDSSFSYSDQKQILAILTILSALLELWELKYRNLLTFKDLNYDDVLVHESLRMDYYYTSLYIYSLALFNDSSGNKKNLRLDELAKSGKYIERAFLAAKEILATATRVHKLNILRFMPVRWVTRIVRSVAFVVKCYMIIKNNSYSTIGLSVIPTDDIIKTVQKAAITLSEASPDDLHLCSRYSTILMYLCSEMRSASGGAAKSKAPDELKDSSQVPTDSETDCDIKTQTPAFANEIPTYQNTQMGNPDGQNNTGYSPDVSQAMNNNDIFGLPDFFNSYLDSNNLIGLNFVEPFTDFLDKKIRDNKPNPE